MIGNRNGIIKTYSKITIIGFIKPGMYKLSKFWLFWSLIDSSKTKTHKYIIKNLGFYLQQLQSSLLSPSNFLWMDRFSK
jgi:hypothetical protein